MFIIPTRLRLLHEKSTLQGNHVQLEYPPRLAFQKARQDREYMPPPLWPKIVLIEGVDSSGSLENSTVSYDASIREVESWSYDASDDYNIISRVRRVKRYPYIREERAFTKPKEVPKKQRSKKVYGRTRDNPESATRVLYVTMYEEDGSASVRETEGGKIGLLIREHKPRANILPLIESKDESDEKLSLTVPLL
jgi:hypothetical protein